MRVPPSNQCTHTRHATTGAAPLADSTPFAAAVVWFPGRVLELHGQWPKSSEPCQVRIRPCFGAKPVRRARHSQGHTCSIHQRAAGVAPRTHGKHASGGGGCGGVAVQHTSAGLRGPPGMCTIQQPGDALTTAALTAPSQGRGLVGGL